MMIKGIKGWLWVWMVAIQQQQPFTLTSMFAIVALRVAKLNQDFSFSWFFAIFTRIASNHFLSDKLHFLPHPSSRISKIVRISSSLKLFLETYFSAVDQGFFSGLPLISYKMKLSRPKFSIVMVCSPLSIISTVQKRFTAPFLGHLGFQQPTAPKFERKTSSNEILSQKKRDGPLSRFPSSQNELQPPADDQFLGEDDDDDDFHFLNDHDDNYQFLNDDDDGGDKRIIQQLFCVLACLIWWVLHDIILIDGNAN